MGYKKEAKNEKIESLHGFVKDSIVTIGNVNPWVEGSIHPDDRETLGLFKNWIFAHFKENQKVEYIHGKIGSLTDSKSLNRNICSIGGPATNLFTRYGMGYDQKGETWAPVLPFTYPLKQAEELAKKEKITVVQERQGQRWEEPNWYIANRNGNPRYFPSINVESKTLRDDYFQIIVAPNTFTKEAFFSGRKHMMIASAHGVSSLAIKEILEDDKILESLYEVNKKTGYYQAIVKIPEIKYEESKKGYFPSGHPVLCEAVSLEPSDFGNLKKYKEWVNP